MSNLIIGIESIEVGQAIKKIKFNIRWLKARMECINLDSDINLEAHQCYAKMIDEQKVILAWLTKYEN